MDDATMLTELLPTAEHLVDRHLGMAKEWFPHDLVEWRTPPEVGSAVPLPDGVASALFVNVLTEDNLPYYFSSIDNLFGQDGVVYQALGQAENGGGVAAVNLGQRFLLPPGHGHGQAGVACAR